MPKTPHAILQIIGSSVGLILAIKRVNGIVQDTPMIKAIMIIMYVAAFFNMIYLGW